eukprot:m.125735 g.125735  ORF g.125735 m.125735 type:complete len:355 (-) comp9695_c0_seq1:3520-4584(-)
MSSANCSSSGQTSSSRWSSAGRSGSSKRSKYRKIINSMTVFWAEMSAVGRQVSSSHHELAPFFFSRLTVKGVFRRAEQCRSEHNTKIETAHLVHRVHIGHLAQMPHEQLQDVTIDRGQVLNCALHGVKSGRKSKVAARVDCRKKRATRRDSQQRFGQLTKKVLDGTRDGARLQHFDFIDVPAFLKAHMHQTLHARFHGGETVQALLVKAAILDCLEAHANKREAELTRLVLHRSRGHKALASLVQLQVDALPDTLTELIAGCKHALAALAKVLESIDAALSCSSAWHRMIINCVAIALVQSKQDILLQQLFGLFCGNDALLQLGQDSIPEPLRFRLEGHVRGVNEDAFAAGAYC